METTIRPYRGSDEAELLRVWNTTLGRDRIDAMTWRTRVLLDPNFQSGGLLLAEEADGRLSGFVLSLTRQVLLYGQGIEPETGWITAFGVAPSAQRQGIGRMLFAAALARMAALARRRVLISPYTPNYFTPGVDVAAYAGAMAFLQEQGWQRKSQPIAMQADLADFQVPPAIEALEIHLAQRTGIFIRHVEAADLPTLLDAQPFPDRRADDGSMLYITFLHQEPSVDQQNVLLALANDNEQFYVAGRELYYRRRQQLGKEVFSNNLVEKHLGSPATTRNVTTLSKIVSKYL